MLKRVSDLQEHTNDDIYDAALKILEDFYAVEE